jgi:acyl-CoA thioesterase I
MEAAPETAPRRSWVDLVVSVARVAGAVPAIPGPVGRFTRWFKGVSVVAGARHRFTEHWARHNAAALTGKGPLWVALGDSAAQGLGADHPHGGYVGQVLADLRRRTRQPWRVVNLSRSGATAADVLSEQLPLLEQLPAEPDLVTIGTGTNDLMRRPLPRVRGVFRAMIARAPRNTVILDVPLPHERWFGLGPATLPLVRRLNAFIRAESRRHGLPVAAISKHFTRPWAGRFAPDDFHPNQAGYRLWADAVLIAASKLPTVDARPSTVRVRRDIEQADAA